MLGRFYEHLVGVPKIPVTKSIGKLRLTVIQLQIMLTEIETTLNSRPLVYLRDDINDHVTTTPMHFLPEIEKKG